MQDSLLLTANNVGMDAKDEQVLIIHHKRHIEGQSIRSIARELGQHRNTVSKCFEQATPTRQKRVMQEVGPRIGDIFVEWKGRSTRYA